MADWWSAAAAAVRLLTRVAVPSASRRNGRAARRSVAFFPLAGGVVGAALGLAYVAGAALLPPPAAAAAVTAVWVWITGALHLDGWMDTADALASRQPPERKRDILKDPRVGAKGAAGGALLLLGKFALVQSLLMHTAAGSPHLAGALAVVPVLARAFLPWAIVGWPYAGGDGGMGAALRGAGARHGALAAAVAAVCAAGLWLAFGSADAVMILPLFAAGAALAAAAGALGAAYLSRAFGGLTGDHYGALTEGLELLLLAALALLGGRA